MVVTALVMAGGRGTRMKTEEEKPLLKVCGKPMIERVLNTLRDAKKVNKIIIAVSKHTPKTAAVAKAFSVKVLKTPGEDFVSDVQYAIKKLELSTVLTISADLPLVVSDVIDEVIERYERCGKPALTVVVPLEICKRLGLDADHTFKLECVDVVPVGINVVDGKRIDEGMLEEEIFVIYREEMAVNVNKLEDLKVAERLLASPES